MVDEALPIRRLTEAGMTGAELAKLEDTWRKYSDNRRQIAKFFNKLALEDISEWLEVQRAVGHFSTIYDPVTDPMQVELDESLALASFIPLAQKGAPEGVPTLDSDEYLTSTQVPPSVVSDGRGMAAGDLLLFDGASFIRLPKGESGQVMTVRADGTVHWISPAEVYAEAWGVNQSNTAAENTTKLNEALEHVNTGSPSLPNGGTVRIPDQGIILINAPLKAKGVGQLIKGSSAYGSVLRAAEGFVGEAMIIWKQEIGASINTVQGLEDIRIDTNGQACHGVVSDKAYDHVYWKNVGIYNVADTQSAAIMQPDPSIENKVSQTFLWANVYATHKNTTATAPTLIFNYCQEANFIGCKSFGASVEGASSTCWVFKDCRGINTVGCSAALTTGAAVKVETEGQKSIGLNFTGMTFESVGKILVAEGASEALQIEALSLRDMRIQGTVGGIELKHVTNSYLESRIQPISIASTCSQIHVVTEDTTKVTDEGVNTTIIGYANAGTTSNELRVSPRISVYKASSPEVVWRSANSRTYRLVWSANAESDFGFFLRWTATENSPTNLVHVTTTLTELLTELKVTGKVGFNGATPVAKHAAIASPAAELAALKTAVDALREVLKNVGLTE